MIIAIYQFYTYLCSSLCLVSNPCQMTGFDIGCEDAKHDPIIFEESQRKEDVLIDNRLFFSFDNKGHCQSYYIRQEKSWSTKVKQDQKQQQKCVGCLWLF